jgi:hypothetical protein
MDNASLIRTDCSTDGGAADAGTDAGTADAGPDAGPAPLPCGVNLFVNPNFDDGVNGWDTYTFENAGVTSAQDGAALATINYALDIWRYQFRQLFNVTAGMTFTLQMDMRAIDE